MDRITQRVDAQGNTVQYGYDGNGNLTSFTDALNNVTTWAYDARNRPISKTDALAQTEHYQYDAGGNLAQKTDRLGQISGFTYDGLNRLTAAGYGASAGSNQYTSSSAYTWDNGDRLTAIDDSPGGSIARTYDSMDNLLQETTAQGTLTLTWDALGRRTSQTVNTQPKINYTWDAASRLKQVLRLRS